MQYAQILTLRNDPLTIGLMLLAALLILSLQPVAAAEGPEATIEAASQDLLSTLRKAPIETLTDPDGLRAEVMPVLASYADFDRMSRLVLGKHWRRATPQQRTQFTEQFQLLMVRFYAASLSMLMKSTSPETISIEVLPSQLGTNPNRVMVRTRVSIGSGKPFPVTYHLYRRGQQWKVYDMAIEGVSIVANYRASFAGEIRTDGLDTLIQRLTERNAAA